MDASVETDTLAAIILDDTADIWDRYGAMFALRNRAQETFGLAKTRENERVVELCSSTLAKRCVRSPLPRCSNTKSVTSSVNSEKTTTTTSLAKRCSTVKDPNEHAMVRHEAAEAIGSRGGRRGGSFTQIPLLRGPRRSRKLRSRFGYAQRNQEEDVVFFVAAATTTKTAVLWRVVVVVVILILILVVGTKYVLAYK